MKIYFDTKKNYFGKKLRAINDGSFIHLMANIFDIEIDKIFINLLLCDLFQDLDSTIVQCIQSTYGQAIYFVFDSLWIVCGSKTISTLQKVPT